MKSKLSELTASAGIVSGSGGDSPGGGGSNYDITTDLPNYQTLRKLSVDDDRVVNYEDTPTAIPVADSDW